MTATALVVALEVLTTEEFESVPSPVGVQIDADTAVLRARYPPEWFARERARLRVELQFVYGVTFTDCREQAGPGRSACSAPFGGKLS